MWNESQQNLEILTTNVYGEKYCQQKKVKRLLDAKLKVLDCDTFVYLFTGFPKHS